MCSRVSRLHFLLRLNTRESSFRALANVFEGLDFLSSNYCEQNESAPSEICQRYRHLNLSLYQKFHLLPRAHRNFEINLMSFVPESLWSSWHPDIKITRQNETMRLFQNKLRFADALLVSHKIIQRMIRQYKIRQSLQNIFKFILMLNWSTFCTYVTRWSGFDVGTERPLERPKSIRSMKFSAGLPQPAYAFVSDMGVPTNSW